MEELLESGMATLVPQSTIDTDAPGEDEALLPNVDETLGAGSIDTDIQNTTSPLGSPTILVTNPVGGISPGNRSKMVKHKKITDTARSSKRQKPHRGGEEAWKAQAERAVNRSGYG